MNPYISLQPEWLANLLAHREFGLAHPRAFVSRQSATGSPFFGASPTKSRLSPNRSTSDALVLGILGEATRKPPIGLFDTGEFDHSEASNYPGIQSAPPSTRRVPTATSIATGTSDALVLRLLDEAASKRPPVALFNSPSVGRQTASGRYSAKWLASKCP
jgi:hypothetical protein